MFEPMTQFPERISCHYVSSKHRLALKAFHVSHLSYIKRIDEELQGVKNWGQGYFIVFFLFFRNLLYLKLQHLVKNYVTVFPPS